MQSPITVCNGKFPIYDKHGRQIRVGDKIRAQVCVGAYGQTRIVETTLTEAHYPLGSVCVNTPIRGCIGFVGVKFKDGYKAEHEHHDYEHGHKTWVEVQVVQK